MKQQLECILCGSSHCEVIAYNNEFGEKRDILRCVQCNLGFVSPLPSQAELDSFYQNDYSLKHQSYTGGSMTSCFASFFSNRLSDIKIDSRRRFLIKNAVSVPGKRVLEIGSANGKLLYQLKKMGAEVYGVEPSEEESLYSKKYYNITPMAKHIDVIIDKFQNYFDIVFCYHVLEHLPSPLGALKKIKGLLKAGGHLIGEVPHTPLDIERLNKVMKTSVFDNLHLFHFNIEAIRSLLEKAGYRIIVLERIELKSLLMRITPKINAHYLHPSYERPLFVKLLSALAGAELVLKNKLFRINAMDTLCNFKAKDWIGPNDWIRFLVKKDVDE